MSADNHCSSSRKVIFNTVSKGAAGDIPAGVPLLLDVNLGVVDFDALDRPQEEMTANADRVIAYTQRCQEELRRYMCDVQTIMEEEKRAYYLERLHE
jgi:hypothetical protein